MNKNLLKFNTYADALDALKSTLDKRKVDLSIKNIVITPEKYTLLCERILFKDNNGAFDVDVFSLARLYFKLGGGFCLPKEGAVLVLKEILSQAQLKCFNRSKKHKGFCNKIYSTICDFILSGISPDELDFSGATNALKIKLDDIKYIYKEFLHRTSHLRIDRHGKLDAIKESITKSDKLFNNANVYIVNFDYITKAEEEIFDLIAKSSLSFNHYFVDKALPKVPAAEIYQAPDAVKAIKAAAKRILDNAKKGIKFIDMCLVCAPESLLAAKRIFNEYKIPLYTQTKESLSARPLSRFLLSLLALKFPSRDQYIALAKNPYSNIDANQAEIFENYCTRFLIDYTAFEHKFELFDPKGQDESDLLTAEEVRKKLNLLVKDFWSKLDKAANIDKFCQVIEEEIKKHNQDKSAQDKLIEILSLMKITLCASVPHQASSKRLAFFIDAFIESIESAMLSSLPISAQCIIASDASTFRGGRFKHTFILDFNEGVVPPSESISGVLNTVDTRALRSVGIESGLSTEESGELKRIEILRLMAASDNVFISYLKTDDLRPSPLIYSLSPHNTTNSYDKEQELLQAKQLDDNTRDFLSFYAACPSGGLEYLLLSAKEPTALTAALYEILNKQADRYLSDDTVLHPSIDSKWLCFKSVSASRLQTYFECPYKHFIKYGLGAKPKPDGQTTALDSGAVIHRIAEEFVKSGLDEGKLDEILDKTPFGYKYDLEQNARYKEKLKKEIKKLCLIFCGNIKSGLFRTVGAEIKIELLANPVKLNGLLLKGSVDYADSYNDYIRIIDYKSGFEQFEEKTLHYGIKLQLPLYMAALINNGYRPAAMFYFRFKSRWQDDGYKFNGVYNNDAYIIRAMDKGLDTKEESDVLTAKIKLKQSGEEKVYGSGNKEESKLVEYCNYALDVCSLGIKQLFDGNIAPSPCYQDSRHTACTYCSYKPSCAFLGEFRRLV